MSEFVESILAEHKKRHQEEEPEEDSEAGKYFSVLKIEGVTTDFLELRFRNGAAFFLSYSELDYFNYDPSGVIDMICGSFTVEIHGRNLRRNRWRHAACPCHPRARRPVPPRPMRSW